MTQNLRRQNLWKYEITEYGKTIWLKRRCNRLHLWSLILCLWARLAKVPIATRTEWSALFLLISVNIQNRYLTHQSPKGGEGERFWKGGWMVFRENGGKSVVANGVLKGGQQNIDCQWEGGNQINFWRYNPYTNRSLIVNVCKN